MVGARELQPPLPRARRGGQAWCPAGRWPPPRVPDDLARREPDEADDTPLPEPDGHGRRGVHPRLPVRRHRAPRRVRQDRAGRADGRGERGRARDHGHRGPVRGGVVPGPAPRCRHRSLALRRGRPRRPDDGRGVRRARIGQHPERRPLQRDGDGLDDDLDRRGARDEPARIGLDPGRERRPREGGGGVGYSSGRARPRRAAAVADHHRRGDRQRDHPPDGRRRQHERRHPPACAGRAVSASPSASTGSTSSPRATPLLTNVRPSGEHLVEDLHRAGGIRAVLHELGPLLHGTRSP